MADSDGDILDELKQKTFQLVHRFPRNSDLTVKEKLLNLQDVLKFEKSVSENFLFDRTYW